MKFRRSVFAVTLATFAGVGVFASSNQSTSAASWHRGTPKALRGSWTHKDKAPLGSDAITVTRNKLDWASSGMQAHNIRNPRWKYLGNRKYVIDGYEAFHPYTKKGFHEKTVLGRRGHYLVMYRSVHSKSGEYFHRS
ncbi:hypothetical protein [Lentilactobacillus hilgardii]|uniref:hypothetical protein n=1 Tax=Lentilactobacillus hilgardii TaxID=1588 RepID=UPI0039ED37B1